MRRETKWVIFHHFPPTCRLFNALVQRRHSSALCSARTLGWLRLLPFTGSAIGKLGNEHKNKTAGTTVRDEKKTERRMRKKRSRERAHFCTAAFHGALWSISTYLFMEASELLRGSEAGLWESVWRLKPGELIGIKLGYASYAGSDQ